MRLLHLQNVKIIPLLLFFILAIQNFNLHFVPSVDLLNKLGIRRTRVLEFLKTASK
jgi:hypothetical protein